MIERVEAAGFKLVAKSERDGETRYSLSCNPDITLDVLELRKAQRAEFLFVAQVNSELPFMLRDAEIPAYQPRRLIVLAFVTVGDLRLERCACPASAKDPAR